jgi:MATE family multidrug resistance protein
MRHAVSYAIGAAPRAINLSREATLMEPVATRLPTDSLASARLPAQRVDAHGREHIDQRAVMALALPLMANSAVQIVLNLTDVWFVGRLSTRALAAVGSVQWLILVVVLVVGSVAMGVQTWVAQAQGARHYRRASQAVWTALWGVLIVSPLFIAIGAARHLVLAPAGIDPDISQLAAQFWFPRVGGAFFGAAVWCMFGFFNGVGRPRTTLLVTCVIALTNAILNQLFIFGLGLGVAGSGWASTVAQALGVVMAIAIFVGPQYRGRYRSNLTWRPHLSRIVEQMRLGFPMGLPSAGDVLGFAIFQMMQVRLGVIGGAATQVVMLMTSIAYLPGSGIAASGTTLVGQSIGAGNPRWAARVGSRVILLAGLYMGGIGILLAVCGPWILPLFAESHDAQAAAMVNLGSRLLWVAAAYQFFDGINMGSSNALRGAGDVMVPAALVLPLSMLLLVPLAHMLTFAPGQGWVHFLPQLGWGAIGGWLAIVVYLVALAGALFLRWKSGAWRNIKLRT